MFFLITSSKLVFRVDPERQHKCPSTLHEERCPIGNLRAYILRKFWGCFLTFSRLLNKKALEYVVEQFRDLDRTCEVRNTTKLH